MADEKTAEMPAASSAAVCAGCGAAMAADQRYCLNCGRRQGESRVDYAPLLGVRPGAEEPAAAPAAASTAPAAPPATGATPREASPFVAVAGIALLGLMLLVGVLIGRGGGDGTDTAATPTVLQVGDGQGAKVADTGATGPSDTASTGASTKDASAKKTSSGTSDSSTDGATDPSLDNPEVASRKELEDLANSSGEDYQQQSENLPDTIAIPGKPPPTDNKDPGGGTDPQVIK